MLVGPNRLGSGRLQETPSASAVHSAWATTGLESPHMPCTAGSSMKCHFVRPERLEEPCVVDLSRNCYFSMITDRWFRFTMNMGIFGWPTIWLQNLSDIKNHIIFYQIIWKLAKIKRSRRVDIPRYYPVCLLTPNSVGDTLVQKKVFFCILCHLQAIQL